MSSDHPTQDTGDSSLLRRSFSGRRSFGPFRTFGLRRNSRNSIGDGDTATDDEDSPKSQAELRESLKKAAPTADIDEDTVSIASSDDDSIAADENDDDVNLEFDEQVLENTRLNSHMIGVKCHPYGVDMSKLDNYENEDLLDPAGDEFQTAPNVVFSAHDQGVVDPRQRGLELPASKPGRPKLSTIGPTFQRNRCTVSLVYGDFETVSQSKRTPRRYVVASDGSDGSQYAVNWTIGTILRDGDEALIVSIMETDSKLDTADPATENPTILAANQRQRQDMAVILAHQAFFLLQRTELDVKVSCQAVHSRNAKHILLDVIDFYAPTMMIVGSRGLESIRGLAGNMSHYLVQKSSVPVMVAHNKLNLPELPRGKADVVNNVRMRHMRLDQAAVEKTSHMAEHDDVPSEEGETTEERVNRLNRKSHARRPAHFMDMHLPEVDHLTENMTITDDPQDDTRRSQLRQHTHRISGSFPTQ